MPVERSAGIIIFRPVRSQSRRRVGTADARAHRTSNWVRNTAEGRKYLVIRSSRDKSTIVNGKDVKEFWDLPKGVLEKGETGLDAAKREAKEEVGIEDLELIPGFKETIFYFTRRDGKPVPKYVAMFLAEAKTDKVKLSWEHDKYDWLPHKEARARITLKPMKGVLEKAENFLNSDTNIRMAYE